MVKGEIHGTVSGMLHASIDGDTNLHLISGEITEFENNTEKERTQNRLKEAEVNGNDTKQN